MRKIERKRTIPIDTVVFDGFARQFNISPYSGGRRKKEVICITELFYYYEIYAYKMGVVGGVDMSELIIAVLLGGYAYSERDGFDVTIYRGKTDWWKL